MVSARSSPSGAGSDRAQEVLGLLGVARPDVGDLEHRGPHGLRRGRRRPHPGRGRRRRRARASAARPAGGRACCARASEKPVTQTRSPGSRVDVASDSAVISRSAPRVVTKVRSALGSTITTQMPVSWSATGGAEATILLGQRVPDQVAVRPGAVRAGVDAVGAEAGGGDQHCHRTAGVVGRRRSPSRSGRGRAGRAPRPRRRPGPGRCG